MMMMALVMMILKWWWWLGIISTLWWWWWWWLCDCGDHHVMQSSVTKLTSGHFTDQVNTWHLTHSQLFVHIWVCAVLMTPFYCNMVALADDSSQFKLIANFHKFVLITFGQTGRAVQISHNAYTTWVHHCLIFHSGFWRQVYSELSPWTHFELHLNWNTK